MEYTIEEKYNLITRYLIEQNSNNPLEIAEKIMGLDFVNMHGPEHHYIDGGAFLVAYKNAGANIDIEQSLQKLQERTRLMPGAMCGFWGVCGAVTSIGASLAIINSTGPLTTNDYYKDNMQYTSSVIKKMSEIGGPRCCKRHAFLAFLMAVEFVKEKYGVEMEINNIKCKFSSLNKQCLKQKCPFFC